MGLGLIFESTLRGHWRMISKQLLALVHLYGLLLWLSCSSMFMSTFMGFCSGCHALQCSWCVLCNEVNTSITKTIANTTTGWHNLFWFSTIPLMVILAAGTKLQAIIAMMAIEIKERHTVIQGMPVVKLSDEHFWFGKPRMILHLIHFVLCQNAFEITYFFWIWYEFGLMSCFHDKFELIIARVCLGAIVQFMCSYITLPLYALVSQMGSQMKRTIFDEQTAKALKKWHKAVVKKKKQQKESSQDPSGTPSMDTTEASQCQYEVPVRHLHRYKTIAHVGATRTLSDSDCPDTDTEMQFSSRTWHLIPPTKQRSLDSERAEVRVDVEAAPDHQDSFSFPNLTAQSVPDK